MVRAWWGHRHVDSRTAGHTLTDIDAVTRVTAGMAGRVVIDPLVDTCNTTRAIKVIN